MPTDPIGYKPLSEIPDEALEAWRTVFIIRDLFSDLEVVKRFNALAKEPEHVAAELENEIYSEIDAREARQLDALVAHTIEQGEADEEHKKTVDTRKLLQLRTARLLKLLNLNAPDCVIEDAQDVISGFHLRALTKEDIDELRAKIILREQEADAKELAR